jgi:hypothetical protein
MRVLQIKNARPAFAAPRSSIGLINDQSGQFAVWTAAEFHAEAFMIDDGERTALETKR